ncbi:MAG: hypothetical protein IH989_04600, partial [Planctomycetes bacterium]|nr:hypothetical protein [Planctomycetota bacterium]
MKSHTSPVLLCTAALAAVLIAARVSATPPKPAPVSDEWLLKKGMQQEGPLGPAILWLDEATQARGAATGSRSASAGTAEALIFHQPNDSGFGYFEKSYTDGPWWYCRMGFGNGWAPGDSISSYELRIFHSTSDDIGFGDADYAVELWDGDPLSLTETLCATAGVSAPIPGTQGIIADVPYGTVVQARVELPAKVAYDCDRVWMVMTSLNGCRAAWRISGGDFDRFNMAPAIGFGNGRGLVTGCESSTLGGVCPTTTGYAAGFCCGSQGTCSGSGAACGFAWDDCPAGETCDGAEACDHSVLNEAGNDYLDPCSSGAVAVTTFCGDGLTDFYFADVDAPETEHGYVGSVFAATDTVITVVPVSVGAPAGVGPLPSGVISLGGDEVVLASGGHDVWLEFRAGDWDPNDLGVQLHGWRACFESSSLTSGLQGAIEFNVGPQPCGECSDNAAPCNSHEECTAGSCSISGDPCHVTFPDCASIGGDSCIGPALCAPSATGDDDCVAALGPGAECGPDPNYFLGTGTCGFTFIDTSRPDWVLANALATLFAPDLAQPDFRIATAVVVGPADDPEPFPDDLLYGATFAVSVPSDAKGTFTISLKPWPCSLHNGVGPPIALGGVVPGFITVQTGRCCYNLQDFATGGEGCFDLLQTSATCAQQPGLTYFEANTTCDEPCLDPVCITPSPPDTDVVPDNSGTFVPSAKNRFISFAPIEAGIDFPISQAARVTFVSLPRPYD